MHIDQPRHHELPGMVDQLVALGAARRACLLADMNEPPLGVEHQHTAALRRVLGAGEQASATHKGIHDGLAA